MIRACEAAWLVGGVRVRRHYLDIARCGLALSATLLQLLQLLQTRAR